MKISIIIVNYNTYKFLPKMFDMLDRQSFKNFEVFLVDNSSSNNDAEIIKKEFVDNCKYSWLNCLFSNTNKGFASGVNLGVDISSGDMLLIMNPDIEILSVDFLGDIIKAYEEKGADDMIMGFSPDEKYNRSFTLDKFGFPCVDTKVLNNAYVYGCLMLVSKELYIKSGGMDNNFFMYFEETDWCVRSILMGYKVKMLTVNSGLFVHIGGGSTGVGEKVSFRIQYSFYLNHLIMVYKNYDLINFLKVIVIIKIFYLLDACNAIFNFRPKKVVAILSSLIVLPFIFIRFYKVRKCNMGQFRNNIDFMKEYYFSNSNPISRKFKTAKSR